MDKHFIIAPTLNRLVQKFKDYAEIESRKPTFLDLKLLKVKERNTRNCHKTCKCVYNAKKPFLQDRCFQLSNICSCLINISKILKIVITRLGRTALETLISNRIVDKKIQFWSPQKVNNFRYFKDIGPTVHTKIKGQPLSIRKEGKLLSRLVVAAKSRPEFNVKYCIGNYEFSVALPYNFHPNCWFIDFVFCQAPGYCLC